MQVFFLGDTMARVQFLLCCIKTACRCVFHWDFSKSIKKRESVKLKHRKPFWARQFLCQEKQIATRAVAFTAYFTKLWVLWWLYAKTPLTKVNKLSLKEQTLIFDTCKGPLCIRPSKHGSHGCLLGSWWGIGHTCNYDEMEGSPPPGDYAGLWFKMSDGFCHINVF